MRNRQTKKNVARSRPLGRAQKPGCNRTAPLTFEALEARQLFAVNFRSFDGTGNNLVQPQWGSTDEAYVRVSPVAYGDKISTPGGADRPSARVISNAIGDQGSAEFLNNRDLSAFVYAWGQFLDHDMDQTVIASPKESMPIPVPTGDQYFDPDGTGTKTIPLSRSKFDPATGISLASPRQQMNSITSFLDGSHVYGSSVERAAALRTFSGGRLRTSAGNLLPLNTLGLPNDTQPGTPAEDYFLAGDVRANENVELTAMQTLFMREHNRLATTIQSVNPTWTDEQIYQSARRRVTAEMQAITYREFLPALLGPNGLRPYQGYKPNVNPGIMNEFATAAFRFGHSMLGTDIEFMDNRAQEVHPAIGLRESFFAPQVTKDFGIDGVMKYLASDRAREIDTKVVDDLRNFLFGPPGSGGLDLAALNIQRGRDHGLADYNSVRAAFGLPRAQTFTDITRIPELQQTLATTYGSVDNIDLWVGGLAEDHVPGGSVGKTIHRIIVTQFERLRDGDRYWYENVFTGSKLAAIQEMTLAKVIRQNTTIWNVQPNVMLFRVEVTGRVMNDGNRDGKLDPNREQGLGNIIVRLRDSSGAIVQSVRTDQNGFYRFKSLDLATYRVEVLPPPDMELTTATPPPFTFTRGQVIDRVDFGLFRRRQPMPPARMFVQGDDATNDVTRQRLSSVDRLMMETSTFGSSDLG